MNYKKCISWYILVLLTTVLFGQEKSHYDKELKRMARTYDSLEAISSDKALSYAKEMVVYYVEKKNPIALNVSYNKLAFAYQNLTKSDSAHVSFDKAIKIARELDNDTIFGRTVVSMTYLYILKNEHDEIASLLFEALQKNQKKSVLINEIYFQLSEVHRELGNSDKAKKYLNKIIENPIDNELLAAAFNSIGLLYLSESEYDLSISNLLKSLTLFKKINDTYNISNTLVNLGVIHFYQEEFDNAEKYWLEAKAIQEKANYRNLIHSTLINLSVIARKKGDYTKCLAYLLEAKTAAEKEKDQKKLQKIYYNLILIHAELNDVDNLHKNLSFYKTTSNELYKAEKDTKVLEIESKYNVAQKEQEVQYQKQLNSEQGTRNTITVIGLLLTLSLLIVSIIFYRQKISAQEGVFEKQEELTNEKIKNMIDHHNLESVKKFVSGQDVERERIAKELHDNVSGNLASLKLQITSLEIINDKIINQLDTTYEQIRDLSHELVAKEFEKQTFVYLVEEYIKNLNTSNSINFSFIATKKTVLNDIDETLQIEIFRIIQELLTNVLKHAKANNVWINLSFSEDDNIHLIVEDDGVGFNLHKKTGVGLKNIHNRIQKINGKITIDSSINNGTIISSNIPLTT